MGRSTEPSTSPVEVASTGTVASTSRSRVWVFCTGGSAALLLCLVLVMWPVQIACSLVDICPGLVTWLGDRCLAHTKGRLQVAVAMPSGDERDEVFRRASWYATQGSHCYRSLIDAGHQECEAGMVHCNQFRYYCTKMRVNLDGPPMNGSFPFFTAAVLQPVPTDSDE